MPKIPTKPRRFSTSLLDAFDRVKVNRVKSGLDNRTISDARLSDAMAKDPRTTLILKDLEKAPRKR